MDISHRVSLKKSAVLRGISEVNFVALECTFTKDMKSRRCLKGIPKRK